MGLFSLFKANMGSIKKQKELKMAIIFEDKKEIQRIISECISEILQSGLRQHQLSVLELIRQDHRETLNQLLSEAFQRGWMRSGEPNLSNAMDEVLLTAQKSIKAYNT